jgi:subtilisin-like proprotein convertase family protein
VPCSVRQDEDVAIPREQSIMESRVTVTGCSGNGSTTSTVELHIVRRSTYDITIRLIAPDGTTYVVPTDSAQDPVNADTYALDLSSEARDGVWTLQVQKALTQFVNPGFLDSWTIDLDSHPCTFTNDQDVVFDGLRSFIRSPIVIAGCPRRASERSTVHVHIENPAGHVMHVSLLRRIGPKDGFFADYWFWSLDTFTGTVDATLPLLGSQETWFVGDGTWILEVELPGRQPGVSLDSWTLTL